MTALMYAAGINSNPVIIAELIKAGADINAKDKDGKTALMWGSKPAIVVELIKAGADVNAKDKDDNTALDIAKNGKNLNASKVIEILTKAGAK